MTANPASVLPQLVRYGAAGLAINGALYLVYLALTGLGLAPVLASSLVFLMGIPISLATHGRFTFQVRRVPLARKAVFAAGYVLGYAVQIGTLTALSDGLGVPHQIAQLCAVVLVALVLFVFQKRRVFRA